jgi:hypothetical protein
MAMDNFSKIIDLHLKQCLRAARNKHLATKVILQDQAKISFQARRTLNWSVGAVV